MTAGPPIFMTWSARTERAAELAGAVGCRSITINAWQSSRRWDAPLRWWLNGVETIRYLARHRPSAVVVQNPPIFLPMIASAYAQITGSRLVLDSHPASFGRKNSRWRYFLAAHRAIARRADLVLVTVPELADDVRAWGGRPHIVHEAPPDWFRSADHHPGAAHITSPPRVLFACVFAPDEPVAEVFAAAAALPEVEIVVTGDTGRAAPGLIAQAPANVRFTGFLATPDYAAELRRSDAVLVLSTEPTSVPRAGYEAVYAQRPLVITSTQATCDYFPLAEHTTNGHGDIADAISRVLASQQDVEAALEAQLARWAEQLETIQRTLGLEMTRKGVPV